MAGLSVDLWPAAVRCELPAQLHRYLSRLLAGRETILRDQRLSLASADRHDSICEPHVIRKYVTFSGEQVPGFHQIPTRQQQAKGNDHQTADSEGARERIECPDFQHLAPPAMWSPPVCTGEMQGCLSHTPPSRTCCVTTALEVIQG